MRDTTNRNRVPQGVTSGGQFATELRTESTVELAPGGQDWLDDRERFAGAGAFIAVTGEDDDYTDFELTAAQVHAAFTALAQGSAPDLDPESEWAEDAERFADSGMFVTVTGGDGEYTDFQLDGDQVTQWFAGVASADHDA